MGFGGSVSGAIKIMKANRDLIKKRKTLFEQLKESEGIKGGKKLQYKEVSIEEYLEFRDRWREELKKRSKRKPYIIVSTILLTVGLVAGMVKLFELVFL